MTGLIWIVQRLHYPSYSYIDKLKFADYQQFHTTQITFIVGPIMVIEVFSGLFLLIQSEWDQLHIINFSGLCIIWLATLFLSVPSHNKLSLGFDENTVKFLVNTNWIRTITWTLRSILLCSLLLKVLNHES